MSKARGRRWLPCLASVCLATACFGEFSDLLALSSALRTAHPGASLAIDVDNGHRTVTVTFDDVSPVAGRALDEAEAHAREIGRFVVEHYEARDAIDELVIVFEDLEERPDGGRVSQRAEFHFTPEQLSDQAT